VDDEAQTGLDALVVQERVDEPTEVRVVEAGVPRLVTVAEAGEVEGQDAPGPRHDGQQVAPLMRRKREAVHEEHRRPRASHAIRDPNTFERERRV
jgi:hypothetical protein